MERERVLSIRDLDICFRTSNGVVNAIRGVRLDLFRGETISEGQIYHYPEAL